MSSGHRPDLGGYKSSRVGDSTSVTDDIVWKLCILEGKIGVRVGDWSWVTNATTFPQVAPKGPDRVDFFQRFSFLMYILSLVISPKS